MLALLDAAADNTVKTWDDLYGMAMYASLAFFDDPNERRAFIASVQLYAFTKALQELPNESDCLVVAKRMNAIVVQKSLELGVLKVDEDFAEEEANDLTAELIARISKPK